MSNAQDSMIEQVAHVHAIDQTTVWLDTIRLSTCNSCSMKSGCGQRLMNQATDCKRSRIELPLPQDMALNVGDEVVLGIPQKAFIKASLLTFAMPLMIMLAFASLAQWGALSEPAAVVAALLGLGLGLLLLRWYSQSDAVLSSNQWQPMILRQQRLDQVQELYFTSE
ncbi:SoxR reducing system RseC family protein [Candidatus Njordibacter sp. Uisw_039]|jgi:sigma-E factor negative regulatory protein RseC|uniref:SoxR reducing system RseC family protein n=1 Tax=Candidatus Njordibacter sp. Uisw_039 TaxID=3230972 RepID=UPI003A41B4A7